MKTWPGRPYPLGATWDGEGVNFALFSENAISVDLCLFDGPDAPKESHRIRMEERTNQTWHVYLPQSRPGLHYGYRVDGPYDPAAGHRIGRRVPGAAAGGGARRGPGVARGLGRQEGPVPADGRRGDRLSASPGDDSWQTTTSGARRAASRTN